MLVIVPSQSLSTTLGGEKNKEEEGESEREEREGGKGVRSKQLDKVPSEVLQRQKCSQLGLLMKRWVR